MAYMWVALGGAIGAVSRYALSGWINAWFGPGTLAIFVINVSGSFLIGVFMTVAEDRILISPDIRRFVAIGVLGGYTTFSTWMYESMQLVETGDYLRATANGLGSLIAGLVAVYVGMVVGRLV